MTNDYKKGVLNSIESIERMKYDVEEDTEVYKTLRDVITQTHKLIQDKNGFEIMIDEEVSDEDMKDRLQDLDTL